MRQGQGSETTDVFFCLSAKMPLYTGVRTGCHYLISMSVCVSVCMCNIRRFTDYESCTRPISTNPGSMEAGEYGLTRGTIFYARRLEVVAVAGLLWISWCVLGAIVFFPRFFSLRASCCKYEAALPHLRLYSRMLSYPT